MIHRLSAFEKRTRDIKIRELIKDGIERQDVARRFGMTPDSISKIAPKRRLKKD